MLANNCQSVVFPWFTIRKVPVEVEIPSSKAVILKFKRGMQQGLLARIATSPVMEYHAFGIISYASLLARALHGILTYIFVGKEKRQESICLSVECRETSPAPLSTTHRPTSGLES